MKEGKERQRLVIVANRLPITIERDEEKFKFQHVKDKLKKFKCYPIKIVLHFTHLF